jgi:hypothetical protein
VVDWRDCRVVISGDVASVRGTVPDNAANWLRDFRVIGEVSRTHPDLGDCASGALDAAEGLLPLIGTPRILTGHSLGGQVAVLLAGLLVVLKTPPDTLVTWDAPKAGGQLLAAQLVGVATRQYRFRGSVVTDYPLFLDEHVRDPLFDICDWTADFIEAHSIERALAWMHMHLVGVSQADPSAGQANVPVPPAKGTTP